MKYKQLIITLAITLVLAIANIFVADYLFKYIESSLSSEPSIQFNSELPDGFYLSLYIKSFLILFASFSLPYLFSAYALKWKIDKSNWWKPILILELVGLLFAYLVTPPDLISTLIVFILWQFPVVVNLMVLLVTVRSKEG